jgi:hypothetical protein
MNDIREALDETVRDMEPAGLTAEGIRARARSRHRRGRLLTTLIALVMAAAGVGWLIASFSPASRPPVTATASPTPSPLDTSTLHLAWTAYLPGGTFDLGIAHDAQHLYLRDESGVVAYPLNCSDPCSPSWRGAVPGRVISQTVAVSQGVVVVTSDAGMWAFGSDCSSDGSLCPPLWKATPPQGANSFLAPLAWGDVVRIEYGVGAMPNHHVYALGFRLDCRTDGGECEPLWQADLGVGIAFVPGTVQDGVFYQQVGDVLTGYEAGCESDGTSCQPVFSVRALGDSHTDASSLSGPVLAGDELLVTSGGGGIYAYRPGCGTECQPLWSGRASGSLEAPPRIAGDTAVVAVREGIVAFPLDCRHDGGTCDPAWRGHVENFATLEYADGERVVAVDHFDRGAGIIVFPSRCAGDCTPLWSAKPSGQVRGVASDGTTLFVGLSDGTAAGYPLACRSTCQPVWTADVGSDKPWNLLVSGPGLFVASGTPGEPGVRLAAMVD